MLKLEIKLDDKKIIEENKYTPESIYQVLRDAFAECNLRQENKPDGTLFFYGTGSRDDFGAFGRLIYTLKDKPWFINYVTKWIWYNSDSGRNENDFSMEDVLYHYTRKESAV